MLYSAAGLVLSLGIAAVAWRRSRTRGGYYDREVYGMKRATHVTYGAIGLAFALFFALALWLRLVSAGIAALALYAVIAVFYLSSFVRGASDFDE
ncbi:MAG: hypothetical protein ABSD52_00655 [Candidatus Cybelea sp.]|jgi:hypothetical protein